MKSTRRSRRECVEPRAQPLAAREIAFGQFDGRNLLLANAASQFAHRQVKNVFTEHRLPFSSRRLRRAGGSRVRINLEDVARLVTECIYVHPQSEHLLPIAEVIPLQLFSYFMALEHGVNVDHPRNLNKAVIEA